MKNFIVNGKLGRYNLTLPENLDEISIDYLKDCTNFIHPAPNYSLIAVVYKDSLSLVLSAAKKNQAANVSVIPVFVKAGDTDSDFIKNFNIGDKCVIAGSDLSIANHINSPYNKITPNNIINICEGDKEMYSKALVLKTPVCFVEFKLVPNSAIHAMLDKTANNFLNPFIRKASLDIAEA